jgi:hypothetical protein
MTALEALQAIKARIDGEWDNPALAKFGNLHGLTYTMADVYAIATEAIQEVKK